MQLVILSDEAKAVCNYLSYEDLRRMKHWAPVEVRFCNAAFGESRHGVFKHGRE